MDRVVELTNALHSLPAQFAMMMSVTVPQPIRSPNLLDENLAKVINDHWQIRLAIFSGRQGLGVLVVLLVAPIWRAMRVMSVQAFQ